jgi:RNA polymerase sigma factor (sigma-70 family)
LKNKLVYRLKSGNLDSSYINIHQGLIESCKTGDRSAQFKIYKLYYKAMYNTSLRIVNDTAEAEDIMQESFLDAFRRLDSYTGEGSFGSWLKRIVINNSLDAIRRNKESVSIEEGSLDFPEIIEENREEELQYRVSEVKEASQNYLKVIVLSFPFFFLRDMTMKRSARSFIYRIIHPEQGSSGQNRNC